MKPTYGNRPEILCRHCEVSGRCVFGELWVSEAASGAGGSIAERSMQYGQVQEKRQRQSLSERFLT